MSAVYISLCGLGVPARLMLVEVPLDLFFSYGRKLKTRLIHLTPRFSEMLLFPSKSKFTG